jgi:predicted transcriptional regulator
MLHIENLDDGLELFKALGSEVRIEIIKLLLTNKNMNMNEIAGKLNLTNGALTSHIKKLENCGVIKTSNESAGHGNQKICSVVLDKILIDLDMPCHNENAYNTSIKVGHYTDFQAFPTCGLATPEKVVGEVDDPRYFLHPDRYDADILWFTKGFVEYAIPNFIPYTQKITQIMISAELSSEAPGVNNNWPSDIGFYLNGVYVGKWMSPGDFGDVRGIFTPGWWYPNWNQYGLLKLLIINQQGTFIDGLKISDITIDQFALTSNSKLIFRMAVDDKSDHVGGLTIFGKSFGNYAQDIKVTISYVPMIPVVKGASNPDAPPEQAPL